jgi:hypothetical protein
MQGKLNPGENIPTRLHSVAPSLFEFLESCDRKLLQSVALGVVLFVIYSVYVRSFLAGQSNPSPPPPLTWATALRFFLLTGWPYAVLDLWDKDWNSTDAARVAFVAFALSVSIWFHSFGFHVCGVIACSLFFPLLLTAAVSHGLGTLRHSLRIGS